MGLKDIINQRRSIRKFSHDNLSDDIVLDLIDCARKAPSAKNRQPWKFVVLRGDEKNKISEMMLSDLSEEDEENCIPNNSVKYSAEVIEQAPILILVFRDASDDEFYTSDILSIGACIEHILLRTTELGLGSLWIRDTYISEKKIKNYVDSFDINVKDGYLVSSIVIGMKAEQPYEIKRKSIESIINIL